MEEKKLKGRNRKRFKKIKNKIEVFHYLYEQ